MSDLESLKAERDKLLLEAETAIVRQQVKHLQAAAGMPVTESHGDAVPLIEDFGDWVDPREYLNDDPNFGFSWPASYFSMMADRQYGMYWPIYRSEQDLMRIRGQAHNLSIITPTKEAVLQTLANYVLGKGFTFIAQDADENSLYGDSEMLLAACQGVIDRFVDRFGWDGSGMDREALMRAGEDGECFLALDWDAQCGYVDAHFLECEQITQPANSSNLDAWLGLTQENPSGWTFGVHSDVYRTDKVYGYHIVYQSTTGDWGYYPVDEIPVPLQKEGSILRLEHIKRNVPRNAKRGVSDFFPVVNDLQREAKLRRNVAEGAALQAAIAWILEAPAGTLASQMSGIGQADTFNTWQRPIANGGTVTQNVNRYGPGTVLKTSAGLQYKPGPLGSERDEAFLLVGAYVLRMCGIRWNVPEYMFTGDASNANMASTLIAESPFVKAREADQVFYSRHFKSLMWKVIRCAYEAGRFQEFGISWDSLRALVTIKVDVPTVATRDELKLVQTQQVEIGLGTLSRHTAAAERGRDLEEEIKFGAKPAAEVTAEPPKEPNSGALQGALKGAVGDAMDTSESLDEARGKIMEAIGFGA